MPEIDASPPTLPVPLSVPAAATFSGPAIEPSTCSVPAWIAVKPLELVEPERTTVPPYDMAPSGRLTNTSPAMFLVPLNGVVPPVAAAKS